mmetsp:Transcript_31100/g.28297  ORF Transcript_31100/g.28297 Transcript_31100/m.28297 type:complete len:293 (-) Transcript_31100:577-1455(-)
MKVSVILFILATTILQLNQAITINTCASMLVDEFAFYNIAPYGKKDPYWSATDGYEIDFSLCEPKVNSCDNSTSLFGRYISSSDQCYPLAKEYSGISLFNSDKPTGGVNVTYKPVALSSSQVLQLIVTIKCDPDASATDTLPPFTISQDNFDSKNVSYYQFYATSSSYYGCSFYNLGELYQFMKDNKAIFVITFCVIGLFVCYFGLKAFKVTIFIMAALAAFFCLALLLYEITPLDSEQWVLWTVFILCLIASLAAGYFAVKLEKLGFFALGACLGVVGFLFLYTAILSGFV